MFPFTSVETNLLSKNNILSLRLWLDNFLLSNILLFKFL